jgi:Flp pilus assembly protein TadG
MRRRRERGERGAVAVEAALVTPFLVLILFGIIEMSMLMRDSVSASSSVRAGARTASALAAAGKCNTTCAPTTAPALAQATASAIEKAGSALPEDAMQWMLVYDANPDGYPLPNGNTNLTCTTNCVKYTWNASTDKFVYTSGSWDTTNQVNACVNDAARDSVGVVVNARHSWITGLFGSGVDLNERSVMQFEPLPNDACKPGFHN